MPSFSTSLSGLGAASTALSVIGNNLANLNTIAFKEQTTSFKDLFYQQLGSTGSGDPIQVGVGTAVGTISSNSTQGSPQSTGLNTDVAIQGSGYFVLDTGAGPAYTRAGNFQVDSSGHLSTKDGAIVLGYPAVNGVVNTNAAPQALTVASGTVSPSSATSKVQLNMNLDETTNTTDSYSTPLEVYDSLGASHTLTFTFTKTATNKWDYEITIPGADVGSAGGPSSVGKGSLTFDGTGHMTAPVANVTGLSIASLVNGAADMKFDWNLFQDGEPTITQVARPSAPISTSQDGASSGSLNIFHVLTDGTIQGSFSNGKSLSLGKIALASFANAEGLQRLGAGNYVATLASGTPNIGLPGVAGRGTLGGETLELSNVDIATEFSNLILAQRSFQANAKSITTLDEIVQEAINLKR